MGVLLNEHIECFFFFVLVVLFCIQTSGLSKEPLIFGGISIDSGSGRQRCGGVISMSIADQAPYCMYAIKN